MSNKQKQVQYLKQQQLDGATAPPRYQPPPQPPATSQGILKPYNPNQLSKDTRLSNAGDPTVKQQPYPQQPQNPVVPNLKLYPLSTHQQFPYVGIQAPPSQQRLVQRHSDENISKLPAQTVHHDSANRLSGPQHHLKLSEEDQMRFLSQVQNKVRISDEDFLRLGPVEMLKFVKKTEADSSKYASEQNKHMHTLIAEVRSLKESNQRLSDDNQELRDLCCFLDDDRQKGRKLAREWQRFGRYTASVMRQEVSAYQNKLRELDNKQQELIKDNLELKELCLYLDEERGGNGLCTSCGANMGGSLRDDGDGSSSSTNADEPRIPTQFAEPPANAPRRSASRERILHENLSRQRSTFNDQTMQYMRNLELKIKQLEEDKKGLQNKLTTQCPTIDALEFSRPEAVVRALQVLEDPTGALALPSGAHTVDDNSSADMDDSEKALVREMCNVVWRKLDDGPSGRH